MASARKVYHSVATKDGWAIKDGGKVVATHPTQKRNEAAAIKLGRKFEKTGGLAQAILHKQNGTIREERTYGRDPRSSRG